MILSYPSAGSWIVPVLCDLVYLVCARPWFEKTTAHFRVEGVLRGKGVFQARRCLFISKI
jgi:hypothetical protein